MFEKFTERARMTLGYARQRAQGARHEYIGTEHVLSALAEDPDSVAGNVLAVLGVERSGIWNELRGHLVEGPRVLSVPEMVPFTPRMKRVIDAAVDGAAKYGHKNVGTGHLLLGLIQVNEGAAFEALRTLGVDFERASAVILARVDAHGADPDLNEDQPGPRSEPIQNPKSKIQNRVPWRTWLRSLHRDLGFLAVGLTFVYALSGLAVNHVADWPDGDPSFSKYARVHTITGEVPQDDTKAVAFILQSMNIQGEPSNTYARRDTIQRLEIAVTGARIEVRPDLREIQITRADKQEHEVYPLENPLPEKDWDAAIAVMRAHGFAGDPLKVERVTYPIRDIEITFDRRVLRAQVHDHGADIFEEGQKPRFFLHAANWLHLNRGKKAWTYVADGFAIVLLMLATTGMLMVRGRQGVFGRGGIFLLVGIAVPVLYVLFAGP